MPTWDLAPAWLWAIWVGCPEPKPGPAWTPDIFQYFSAFFNHLFPTWGQPDAPHNSQTCVYEVNQWIHVQPWFQEGSLASKSLQLNGTILLSWGHAGLGSQNSAATLIWSDPNCLYRKGPTYPGNDTAPS